MVNKKKIIIIVPSLKAGGLERVASILANSFIEKKYEVRLISLSNVKPFYNLESNVEVILPNKFISNLPKVIRVTVLFFWLRTKVNKFSIPTILTLGEGYNSFFIASLLGLRKKIFVSNRASPLSSLKGVRGRVNPFFYKYTQAVLVQTEKAIDILKPTYPRCNFKVIYNPFILPIDSINTPRQNVILNVGSIGGKKNQKTLIEYFSKIENLADWKLYFIGDGPQTQTCKELVNNLNLNDKIFFLGKQSNVDMFYATAKIFAFTSTSEGFPNALGEAMSFGLAPISFDCITGPSELIDDGENGFLIENYDDSDYIKKLSLLMQDEKLRNEFGEKSKNKMENFDKNLIIKKYEKLMFL